jgi:hypothetical protein
MKNLINHVRHEVEEALRYPLPPAAEWTCRVLAILSAITIAVWITSCTPY